MGRVIDTKVFIFGFHELTVILVFHDKLTRVFGDLEMIFDGYREFEEGIE